MYNFAIHFSEPLWLLLLIPAIVLILIPYFLSKKKYRRTRNRIISMVLHIIVSALVVCVLAGIEFSYQVPNDVNEIILLVDVSDTTEKAQENRDDFIETVLNMSYHDGYKVGVVTFGFTQEYAVPLTYKISSIFSDYQRAPLPDTSATDIAAALRYASGILENPETAKIVLISDGKETDETALSVIRAISAQGTKVDTVLVSPDSFSDNVQIIGIELPSYHVKVDDECTIEVTVNAKNGTEDTVIEIFDNGQIDSDNGSQTVNLSAGAQVVSFRNVFRSEGLHEICVKVTEKDDRLQENNVYYAYLNLEVYTKILIIDRGTQMGESDALASLLAQEGADFEVEQLHLMATEQYPETVDELRAYDQIILNNIANSDLEPFGLVDLLYSYVYEYGGGLFTAGGNNSDGTAHAYNRQDLNNTLLHEMLPVQAIDYTPPVGVIFIIDVSGSMGDKLEWAKSGTVTALAALTERDYVGIMTLSNEYSVKLQLTSRTEETVIKEAINNIKIEGATNFSDAIVRASQALIAEKRVDKRHVVIVTDGMPSEDESAYIGKVGQYNKENGITFSVIGIQITDGSGAADTMNRLTAAGGGVSHFVSDEHSLLTEMRADLNADAIKELEEREFHPVAAKTLSPLLKGVEIGTFTELDGLGNEVVTMNALEAKLGGFYGVQARAGAETVLVGEYNVPIYSQWKFGKGMVGSFMCDLSGTWSSEFMTDLNAQRFLYNVIVNLMPTENIRPNDVELTLKEGNYINQLSIYTDLAEGETLEGSVIEYVGGEEIVTSLNALSADTGGDCYVTLNLSEENHYTRATFVIKRSGVYKIIVNKRDAEGNLRGSAEIFKSFSYSQEYDTLDDSEFDADEFLEDLAVRGNGTKVDIEEPGRVFSDFVTRLNKTYDPRIVFMAIALVLFLADVAVRKFKFKWPHEIIRELKEKEQMKKS